MGPFETIDLAPNDVKDHFKRDHGAYTAMSRRRCWRTGARRREPSAIQRALSAEWRVW
jgi:hypothetical protein